MQDKEKQGIAKRKHGTEKESSHHGWYHSSTKNINDKKVKETKYHIDYDTKATALFGWKRSLVEKKTPALISILSLIVSLFLLTSNLTGYTISNIDQSSSNIVAGVFFSLGIIAAFFYFRIR